MPSPMKLEAGQSNLEKGNELSAQGNFKEAIEQYKKAIDLEPSSVRGWEQLAIACEESEELDTAISCYRQIIQLRPKNSRAYINLAKALKQQNQIEEAIVAYQDAIELKPEQPPGVFRDFGKMLSQKGKLDDAIAVYERAISLNPERPAKLYLDLGDLLTQKRQFNKALPCYLKAIEINPDLPSPYQKLKFFQVPPSHFNEVTQCFYDAIEKNPDLPFEIFIRLGDILTKQGKIEEAIECYRKASYNKIKKQRPRLVKKGWDFQNLNEPDFIIMGVGKCGTTALAKYLEQHPKVLFSIEKELHFFSKNFKAGLDWYKAHFPSIPENRKFLTGEATPWYFSSGGAEKRIFKSLPHVKLILILRNPVDRAFSHYSMNVKLGREHRSFEEAIASEIKVLQSLPDVTKTNRENYWKTETGNLLMGLYICFLEKWLALFPKEQILILRNEDLSQQPAETMQQVFQFLELPDFQLPRYKKHNSGSYSPMSEDVYQTLSDFFVPYNEKLEERLNMKFDW
ncbi:tetratricopeptide repeat protein [Oscillatoriales cyanobacterium LEGE 11467]|uniref:Tetratricopeptide repeat protein n=1 Tax=Zarconia navalis LEGE 11467 TaxID=1828826 RepID=A0A928VVQ8_9CYAN|nr:tetratricopeptide repeat protein [Zarconia navalis]MBE9039617.1 tetratricopeptide repeat protein [Zarconia navalis LEGE 11467]